MKGQINGKQANVIFDTGSWPNAIGNHLKSELSGPIDTVGPAVSRYEVCDWENLQLGQFKSVSTGRICLVDFDPMAEALGIDIDAIAGTPFATDRVFEIDFENKMFLLRDSPKESFYQIVKDIEFDETGSPWVEVTIGNRTENFLVDTGFDGFFSVNESLAEDLRKNGFAKGNNEVTMQVYSGGFINRKEVSMSIAKQEIFGYEFSNVPVIVSTGPESTNKIGLLDS